MGDIVLCSIAWKRENKGLINKLRSENQFGMIPLSIIRQMNFGIDKNHYPEL